VILKVYDILGNEVATLVNEPKEPGYYEVEFSIGSFRNASELASGVYIYRLTAGNSVASRKMMLIK
ncbi:MAG: T9SS type A sorting domain-containing protein, partial [Ignavibacterium sp.]